MLQRLFASVYQAIHSTFRSFQRLMILSLDFIFLSSSILVLALANSSSLCADTLASVPFLRASSIIQSDHFYTTNISEIESTLFDGVFSFDGNSAFLWSTPQPGTIPLFRLYNENSTDHFYTMSSDELPEMMARGWAYDTAPNHTAGYVYPFSICGAAPIYRLFNPTITDHFYTMDIAECQSAAKDNGYQDQGIAGFAILPSANGSVVKIVASAVPNLLPSTVTASPESQVSVTPSAGCANNTNAIPFMRAISTADTDHFYTTNSTEMNVVAIAQNSYLFEGDTVFLWPTQESSTVPLYRLYSQTARDHFYTIDANELSEALLEGYVFDTDSHIAGYVYPYSICGASPIYRLYSSFSSDHYYTMTQAESASATASFGYIVQGIAGFALLPSADGQLQTVTVSASPFLLPVSIEPSPTSSSRLPAFLTTVSITPSSLSFPSKALVQSVVSRREILGLSVLTAVWMIL
ncbi:hypothetical protein F5879DRAFT_422871 [Lentinula edodes]|nr:hypothetical protein F5879DRAFT_422871 [Lentinula edodes]